MPIIAETARLHIRTWDLNDISALHQLTHEPGLSEYSISGYANFTRDQARHWILREISRFAKFKIARFAITLRESNELIGISGLFELPPPRESEVEMNYRYPIRRRGNGYALEAAQAVLEYGFKELNLPFIHANADLTNLPSHKILNRLGMKRVGEIEYAGIKAGRWRIDNPG